MNAGRWVAVAAATAALLALGACRKPGDDAGQPPPTPVAITDDGFAPRDAYVGEGGTVVWTNRGNEAHRLEGVNCRLASPALAPGASFRCRFGGVYLYEYRCALHPDEVGTVFVSPPQ